MTINEYQELAMTTLNPELSKKEVLINSVMGLCGESGEAIDIVKKWMAQGHELDKEHLARELGDIAWYLAEAATVLEIPLEDILQANIYGRLTVGAIAKAVGKSESTVKMQFHTFYSGGIMRYYNDMKIREAKKLIRENRYTMAQIAELLCYDSAQYFSKCFHDATRMTPTQYRRSILKPLQV